MRYEKNLDHQEPAMSIISYRTMNQAKIEFWTGRVVFAVVLILAGAYCVLDADAALEALVLSIMLLPVICIVGILFLRKKRRFVKEMQREYSYHKEKVYVPAGRWPMFIRENAQAEQEIRREFFRTHPEYKNMHKFEEEAWLEAYHELLETIYARMTDKSYESVMLWHFLEKPFSSVDTVTKEEREQNHRDLLESVRRERRRQQTNQRMRDQQMINQQMTDQQMMNQQMMHF